MKIANQRWLPVMAAAIPLLLVACNKESIQTNYPGPEMENVRFTGAVEDDPSLVDKIPMIVSADFLASSKNFDRNVVPISRRGKKDLTAPKVSITSPGNGSTVSGSVTVLVNASDNVGVSTITLSVDGVIINTLTKSPASFTWNSATASNGSHTIAATAKDAAGNIGTASIQVSVNNVAVGDITKPNVSITSPTNSSSISGAVTIAASASDNVGVSAVTFSVDGATIGSDNSAPYSISWNTSSFTTGVHTVTATATDAAGNFNSSSVQVTVNTVVINPPTLPGSYQVAMPPVANQGSEGSCVSFAVGYAARSREQLNVSGAGSYSYSSNIFSPEFLYNQTKVSASCGSGSTIIEALELLKNKGICTWQSMPYSSSNGCDLLPNSAQLNEAATFKITSYSTIYTSDISSIKTMLTKNHPLVIMFAIDQSFYSAGPDFIWRSFSSSGGILHAVTICGYDDAKHAVKIMNSWGTSWGDAGYTWIDYDLLPILTNQVVVMNL